MRNKSPLSLLPWSFYPPRFAQRTDIMQSYRKAKRCYHIGRE